ncbi:hypothetical protein [Flammeovirga aprica]|uniref:Lipoprotein n=1 Tax=Flammeovirga aprica JL-4 TaxID=694437 RepID=A0A7X9XB61_9BACT|nr:hypothetical protein [Flammeovirga aprica]NME70319.1 hypothetical protein [Flammeovirga aprica JL-4]
MKYLLYIPLILGVLSCETYSDPSIEELRNTNIISTSNWSAQKANFVTNFDVQTRELSATYNYGPGEVDFIFSLDAGIDGMIDWDTKKSLDDTDIKRYFIVDEDFLFQDGLHMDDWEWNILSTEAKDSLPYTRAYLRVGSTRIKAKLYEDKPNQIYCYYDKAKRVNGYTYKYHINFWMRKE